ncbi:MAG: hypothetical protein QXT73_00475 [Candidatus Methanomethylicaceae archaeon]
MSDGVTIPWSVVIFGLGGLGSIMGFVAYILGKSIFNGRFTTRELCNLKHIKIESDLDEIKAMIRELRQAVISSHIQKQS